MNERFSGTVLRNGEEDTRPSMGEIGLNHFAPYLMNRVMARYNANLVEGLKDKSLTTVMTRTLAILAITPSATINELAVFAVTEQSTMSRALDAMEELNYIRRQPRAEDMRVRDVVITEEGRAAFDDAWPIMYGLLLQMFDGVDEDEYRAFTATLHKILLNIRKHEI